MADPLIALCGSLSFGVPISPIINDILAIEAADTHDKPSYLLIHCSHTYILNGREAGSEGFMCVESVSDGYDRAEVIPELEHFYPPKPPKYWEVI